MTTELSQAWAKWSAEQCLQDNLLKWRGKNIDIPSILPSEFQDIEKICKTPTFSDGAKQIQEALIHAACNLAYAQHQIADGNPDYQITVDLKLAEISSFIKYSLSRPSTEWGIRDYLDFVYQTNESN